jgi:carboxymethylenebutenolidase
MNIFPPSISRSNDPSRRSGYLCRALVSVGWLAIGGTAITTAQTDAKKLPPFLDQFKHNNQPAILSRTMSFASALGPVNGFLARPDTKEQLPAVLLVHDEAGLTEWMKQNTRELSSIGYIVLAVDLAREIPAAGADRKVFREDERALAKLSAALRWLRRRSDVMPDRIGVVGWSWGAGQALALAASAHLQACVLCYGPVPDDPGIVAGLHGTPLLCIVAGDAAKQTSVRGFRQALAKNNVPHKIAVFEATSAGFMGPPARKEYIEQPAEDAWVEMYEFLGKYVEDADLNQPQRTPPKKSVAAIADIMRAANSPTGLRGALIRSLVNEPADARAWKQVRAESALLAEAATLLEKLKPPRGSHSHWQEQVHAFRQAALNIVTAADQHNFAEAQRGLEKLGNQCAACHKKHR